MPKVKVIQPEEEIPFEVLAESIIKISEMGNKIQKSRLNQRALVLLIQDQIGQRAISREQICYVLNCLPELEKLYIRKGK